MKNSQINYVVVGGFVLVMVVALLASIALLTGRTGATDPYFAVYDNVSGVQFGTKVMYEGYPIGQVDRIEPVRTDEGTSFRVHLEVQEGWPIPVDSVARVAASGLLAAVAIDIKGGSADSYIEPGSKIPSGSSGNMFAAVSEVAAQVGDLSENGLMPLLETLNDTVGALSGSLKDEAPKIIGSLALVAQDLAQKTPRITENAEILSADLRKVLADGNAEKLQSTITNVTAFSENLLEMSKSLEASRVKVDELVTGLNQTLQGNQENIDDSIKDLRYTLQAVSRNIDSITYNMDGTTRNLLEFSRQVRENPGVLLRGTGGGEDGPRR